MGTWDLLVGELTTLMFMPFGGLPITLKTTLVRGISLILVTDRWFLDEGLRPHIKEVHDGVIDPFDGGYSAYVQARVRRDRQATGDEQIKMRSQKRAQLACSRSKGSHVKA